MPSEPVEHSGHHSRKPEVLAFAEAVRSRSNSYFGTDDHDSGLAAAVVRQAANDAMYTAEGTPAIAELVIHSDLRFTISDNAPIPYSAVTQGPVPYWHWSKELTNTALRAGLAAAAALSSLAVIQVSSGGRSWRQEFTRGRARSAPADDGPATDPGTRVTFELDAGYFTAGTAIPHDAAELKPTQRRWRAQARETGGGRLTITDLRT